jgi:glucose dehydrogenase
MPAAPALACRHVLEVPVQKASKLLIALAVVAAAAPAGAASATSADWPLPNADLANTRHVVGGPIDASSIGRLQVAWRLPIHGHGLFGTLASTPIVVDGILYTQDLGSNVTAVDVQDGHVLWRKRYGDASVGPNGVTIGDGRVYGATASAAFALDANSGRELWRRRLVRNAREGVDMAPGFNDGVVYVSTVPGNVSTFYAGNGQAVLWALDAATGRPKWRFAQVPASLWGDADVNSGGGLWHPPAFDDAGGLYFDVANPAPFPGTRRFPWATSRPGPNLYTNSVVKLRADSGKLEWFNQLLPHDVYDWDLSAPAILAQAGARPVVLAAGKMGYVYELDRASGRLLWKRAVGRHNGHDRDNLLALHGRFRALELPRTLFPGELGGVESQMAVDDTSVYAAVNNLAASYRAQAEPALPDLTRGAGELVALDLRNGTVKWDHRFAHSPYGAATVVNDVVLTTTVDGTVWGLSTATGRVRWKARLPASTNAPVAVAGDTLLTAGSFPLGRREQPQIVAYRLGPDRPGPDDRGPVPAPAPPTPAPAPAPGPAPGAGPGPGYGYGP